MVCVTAPVAPDVTPNVDVFEPIGLAEVKLMADLATRRDRKYLVDPSDLDQILSEADSGLRSLEIEDQRAFNYESVYFDTPKLTSYLDAARRRPRRFKVRTRSYLDSAITNLEVKERHSNGLKVKQRFPYRFMERDRLTPGSLDLLAGTFVDGLAGHLEPTLTVNYQRSTLVDTHSWSRVTIDTGLTAAAPDGRLLRVEGLVVVETKSAGHPTAFDHLLWRYHYRPTTMSKYCTPMAALNPSLPANTWNRNLRKHFGWEPIR